MSDVVEKIQQVSIQRLSGMVVQTIADTERQVVDAIGDFRALSQQGDEVVARFEKNMNDYFDELLEKEIIKEDAIFNFETLSLVQEEELDVMVALEGMVNASRNEHLAVFISFNTRIASLFSHKRVDESSNPLDPEQVATAFQEALRPLGLDAQNNLTVYRAFNADVLKRLDKVLQEANDILVDHGVLPDLGMEASQTTKPAPGRSTPRVDPTSAFGTVEEEAHDDGAENPELFSMMQNLLHSDDKEVQPAIPDVLDDSGSAHEIREGHVMVPSAMLPDDFFESQNSGNGAQPGTTMQPYLPKEGQTVQIVDQQKLMDVLTSIQAKLSNLPAASIPGSMDEVEKIDISQSLGEILQSESAEDVVSAVDRQSSDIINLVTLLFEAIWQDQSVPIPIKELIGRTQITIIKVALEDVDFFNNENHPARMVLNEFASAGIGWTEVEDLDSDPLYDKIRELVNRIMTDYAGDMSLFEELITDFKNFKAQESAKTRQLEQRILKATERQDRIDDINELVTQKIDERILGRDLDEFIEELLRGPFHKFMVMLVLKEGPGSSAWKQSINTIDVLLWSVQSHDQNDDRDRLSTVNPRLINNLRKAFRIAGIDGDEVDELIDRLQAVQLASFGEESPEEDRGSKATSAAESEEPAIRFLKAGEDKVPDSTSSVEQQSIDDAEDDAEEEAEEISIDQLEELADASPFVQQVDNLVVGQWVEFSGQDEDSGTRCKLAAKINAIDKLIFVNRQGVKVVEKTRIGLAEELRDGTVSIISDGLLFSRALESVIGNLRESQHEQQTASAYQPDQEPTAES